MVVVAVSGGSCDAVAKQMNIHPFSGHGHEHEHAAAKLVIRLSTSALAAPRPTI